MSYLPDLFHEMTPMERKCFEESVKATRQRIRDAFKDRNTMADILRDQRKRSLKRSRLKPATIKFLSENKERKP